MKYAQRSTAAIAAATLVGGGGIAAAVTGAANAGDGSAQSSSTSVDKSQRPALAAALKDLVANSRTLDAQLSKARHDLLHQSRELQRLRALRRTPLSLSGPSTTLAGPAGSMSAGESTGAQSAAPRTEPAPPTDTSTGASGGGGGDDNGNESDDGKDHGSQPGGDD
jgi:hypothetical protein